MASSAGRETAVLGDNGDLGLAPKWGMSEGTRASGDAGSVPSGRCSASCTQEGRGASAKEAARGQDTERGSWARVSDRRRFTSPPTHDSVACMELGLRWVPRIELPWFDGGIARIMCPAAALQSIDRWGNAGQDVGPTELVVRPWPLSRSRSADYARPRCRSSPPCLAVRASGCRWRRRYSSSLRQNRAVCDPVAVARGGRRRRESHLVINRAAAALLI
jgi:hypothetical protein